MWTERWFLSCNAKDIGTLYLIFALFSGLVGTAFSVLVRLCALFVIVSPAYLYSIDMETASSLGICESIILNIAYLLEACKMAIPITHETQAVVPMVKVRLLESYPSDASGKGPCHVGSRTYSTFEPKLILESKGCGTNRVTWSNLKVESRRPKGTSVTTRELRDCLRVGTQTIYGNGASILNVLGLTTKGSRERSLILIWVRYGVRSYSTKANKKLETYKGDRSRKFKKLVKFCANAHADVKVDDLFIIMLDKSMYEVAYHKLRSKPGNMTPGIDSTTLDGISSEWFDEIILKLQNKTFEFKPGRRVHIPKPNGGTRPLTDTSPRDKIVQEVMRMILEAIFEPIFLSTSHGFRPNKGCHTALRQIKTQFGSSSWYIEGDISKCFDSFDHHILIYLISMKINDTRFIDLIWKALRAGYFEFFIPQDSIIGTPQGSVISPILSNIYLHQLDVLMDRMKKNFDKGKLAQRNPEYRKLEYKRGKALKDGDTDQANKHLKEMQNLNARLPNDPNFRRLYYVRYADDWIIAIRGQLSDAKSILANIQKFLSSKLKLNLSLEKSKITNGRTGVATFLGINISASTVKGSSKGRNHQRLRTSGELRMLAPMGRIYKKLAKVGFMDIEKKYGVPRLLWYHNNKDTIVNLYNSILRGYLNYYSFTHNYNSLASSLEFILKNSCAKLLAAKFKLGSASKALRKFGSDLKGNDKAAFLKPSYKLNTWDFKINAKDRIKTLFTSHISTATLDSLSCEKCGSKTRVEMHHVRLLKDLNPKLSEIDKIMAKRRRKQIPLCRPCHLDHHKNSKSWGKRKKT